MKRQKVSGKGEAGSSQKSQTHSSPASSSRRNNFHPDQEKQPKQKHDSMNTTTTTTTDADRSADDNAGSAPPSPSPANPAPQIPPIAAPSRIRLPLLDQSTGPPPPPAYGFHNLERRTIVLADGSVRSYFALPPDSPLDPYGPAAAHRRAGIDLSPPLGVGPISRYDDGQHLHFSHVPSPYPHPHPRHTLDGAGRLSPRNFREPLPPYGREGAHHHESWSSLGVDGAPYLLKRKHGDGEEEEYARHRQHVLQHSMRENPTASYDRIDNTGRSPGSPILRNHVDTRPLPKHLKLERSPSHSDRQPHGDSEVLPPDASDVDPQAVKKAFLMFSKSINESSSVKKNYLDDGRHTRLACLACGRSSKEFADMHGLIMHTYNSQEADLRADHLGLHKALCVLMGWNYAKAPDDSKAYRVLSANDAASNKEDLIMWPPIVIIHNTRTGRRKDGRMEGIGNKEMDRKLKEFGFSGGKAKAVYGKEGHLGTTVVKFANTQTGLKEAEQLAEFFEKDGHGRLGWAHAEASQIGSNDDGNPTFFKVDEKTGEKKRIFFGYLATASDLEKVDHEVRKKADIKSKREFDSSN